MIQAGVHRPRINSEARRFLTLLAFISPWIAGFLFFVAYPIAAGLYYSFTEYNVFQPPRWVGLSNYQHLLFNDGIYRTSIGDTLYYVALAVPLATITALILAVILNTNLKYRSMFRTIFFLPSIVPAVASAMLWLWILDTRIGLVNSILRSVGLPSVGWLSSPSWSKPSLIIITCWACGGAMLIFLAALQDVPHALYDAAKVDGAGSWQSLIHVTVPMVTPSILFNVLTGLIAAFQYFTFAWILTTGGPNESTEFMAVYLYRNAFQYFKMGYASAQAWILFLVVVVVAVVIFRTSAHWVYYGGTSD